MKCVVGQGRPKARTFLKLGKVEITRPDNFNWAVTVQDNVRYYNELPLAIKKAAQSAAESHAKDAQEWLANYDRITRNLERTLDRALKLWTEEGA